MSKHLERLGPWALVTGASDGIGRATARALAAEGFPLVLAARRGEVLEALAAELRQAHGVEIRVVAVDLADPAGVDRLAEGLPEIGLAVLAAGFGTSGAFVQGDLAAETQMLRVNCGAVLTLSHRLGGAMRARGRGQLVLFGSLVGFQGNAMSAHYAATKAYVQTLAEGLGHELRPHGVQVLAVAPGPVASGFADRAGMVMGMADRPEAVAAGIVKALGTSGTIRPGFVSKLLGWAMAATPRPLRIRIMSAVMSGMAQSA